MTLGFDAVQSMVCGACKAVCEAEGIRSAAAARENTVIVDGMDLVPHDVAYYCDYGCHPNDRGFAICFDRLWERLQGRI